MSTESADPTTAPDDTEQRPGFADLGLSAPVLQALSEVGYESPSPIQAATIPPLMAGRHVVGLAQTGTGKTAAFALPILSRIDTSARKPQALVLAPTRELALQVAEAIGKYAHHLPELHVLPIYGGQSYGIQLSGLRRGAQVIVGTPGRVIDHLEKRTLDLSELKFLVLDEADEMLNLGFAEDVERILADTPDDKQVALFSATMPSQIRRLSKRYLTDAAEITVKNKTVTAANTRQRYVQLAHSAKMDALTRFLEVEDFDAMIIFARTKSATEDVAERLRARGLSAAAINGDLVQAQRERTIGQLKSGALDILVATDVAARGLDVERITHVVNYDIPADAESYVHRIGRTGRAGRSGDALMFVTPRERHLLATIERATRQPITEIPLPSVEDVNAQRVAKFGDSITASLGSPEVALFRQLITDYERDHDVPVIEIAAALAVLSQDDKSFLLKPDPVQDRRPRERSTRGPEGAGSGARVAGQRKHRSEDGAAPEPRAGMAKYRLAVGRRHKVQPGAIVGALANEGGLSRQDFGHIDIRGDHTLVDLPANLPADTYRALEKTRVSGQLIHLRLDDGPPPRRRDDNPVTGGGAPPYRDGKPSYSDGGRPPYRQGEKPKKPRHRGQ
ncbi:DEAD/DEAH box helicase [Jatrophihabitans telluris]|uniref:ATP-dependent RNA helicase DeaD n=1 Tax=Jatrophihabitans telluris TaxID=2038343 RepID=A0ABY4QZ51_9ACTN|nr:DEAD/DEAH box helicase [Jatrophihabitans telluris]UQX88492.1 DEAD/DEAH box helicase [Jatrophihabitans telluris]